MPRSKEQFRASYLLLVRCFVDDPQCILAAVHRFALVNGERLHYFGVRLLPRPFIGPELLVATLTHTDSWGRFLYDPQTALGHVQSLAHREGRA